ASLLRSVHPPKKKRMIAAAGITVRRRPLTRPSATLSPLRGARGNAAFSSLRGARGNAALSSLRGARGNAALCLATGNATLSPVREAGNAALSSLRGARGNATLSPFSPPAGRRCPKGG